jgi:hypothetical protein
LLPTINKKQGESMNSSKLSNWLQIAANVGIVAGLLLVGMQLKQNTDLLKTQLLYEESVRLVALETQVVGENGAEVWAKSIADPGNLTLSEQRVMEALLWSYVEQLRSTRMLGELGLLTDDEWRARVESDTAFYLANDYGRAWWANFSEGTTSLSQDLLFEINSRLSRVDTNFTADYTESVMDLVRKSATAKTEDQE